ncbi:conserved exported protein of unknown function [Hyphomicrobium sp. 1Nfss2.1]|uniref:hypothetical protein n=1 Tax=Hyphomicrobium sp. 1Nfss2.1 TaxID=3413936 RepID=UPI003C7C69EE
MELAIGAFALLGGSTAAAGGAAAAGTAIAGGAAAAGAAASWAGIGSTALSVISGVMTAGSVLSSLAGGQMSNQEAQLQAAQVDLQSREEAARIKTEELQKIGATRVAFAGSGVSLSSGDAIESGLRSDADFETELATGSSTAKAAQIRLSGKGKLIAAAGDAAGAAGNLALSLARRG